MQDIVTPEMYCLSFAWLGFLGVGIVLYLGSSFWFGILGVLVEVVVGCCFFFQSPTADKLF